MLPSTFREARITLMPKADISRKTKRTPNKHRCKISNKILVYKNLKIDMMFDFTFEEKSVLFTILTNWKAKLYNLKLKKSIWKNSTFSPDKNFQQSRNTGKLFNIIKDIYNKPTSTMVINGERQCAFTLKPARRQKCPPSLLLFNIELDILASAKSHQKIKRHIGRKGRTKTLFIHRWHLWLCGKPDAIYKKLSKLITNLVRWKDKNKSKISTY